MSGHLQMCVQGIGVHVELCAGACMCGKIYRCMCERYICLKVCAGLYECAMGFVYSCACMHRSMCRCMCLEYVGSVCRGLCFCV